MIVIAMIAIAAGGFLAGLLYANDRMVTLLTASVDKNSVEIGGKQYQIVPEWRYTELLLADLYEKRDLARRKTFAEECD